MELENFELSSEYLVRTIGTSDGTQDKYFKDNKWFKLDRYGGEGIAEAVASKILKYCGLDEKEFVEYHPCLINGKSGCYSENFLRENDSFITLYRLYKNVTGRDLASVTSKMDYDDAIEYVLSFVRENTGLDLHTYLANNLFLDNLILNEDRHFNNLGIIYNETSFLTAPIFDNGKSFLIGNKQAQEKSSLVEKVSCAYSKCFSPSFSINTNYLKKWTKIKIDQNVFDFIKNIATEEMIEILKLRIK